MMKIIQIKCFDLVSASPLRPVGMLRRRVFNEGVHVDVIFSADTDFMIRLHSGDTSSLKSDVAESKSLEGRAYPHFTGDWPT